jgi:hypothetical protein
MIPKTSLSVQIAWRHYGVIKVSRARPIRWALTMDSIQFKSELRLPVYSPRSTFIKCYPSMVTKNFEKFILDGTWSNFSISNMVTIISNCLNIWNDYPLRWKSSVEYTEYENIAKFAIDDIVAKQPSIKKHAESILDWMVA